MDHQVENAQWWADRPLNHDRFDWPIESENWIEGYKKSVNHPHRNLIVQQLQKFNHFDSLLEVGCSCGPNLYCIGVNYRYVKLAGIDPSEPSIKCGRSFLPDVHFRVGTVQQLPYHDNEFDIVLTDAMLMYVPPEEIDTAIDELSRVSKRGVILVEWDDPSSKGKIRYYHWARNYKKLLKKRGFKVEKIKIPKGCWPTKSNNWETIGHLYVGFRQVFPISETNSLLDTAFQSGIGGQIVKIK